MDILGALKQLHDAIVQFLSDQLSTLLTTLATLLTTSISSSFAVYKLDWFGMQLGAVVGIAQGMMVAVAVIVGLFLIGQPFARHTQVTGRLFSSIWMMMLFVIGFYTAVDVALIISVNIRDLLISVITGTAQPDLNKAIDGFLALLPGVVGVQLILMLIMAFLACVLWCMVIVIAVATFFVILVYPITLVLRPLGGVFDKLFHSANTTLVVSLVSPPLMTAAILLPELVGKIPFLGNMGGRLVTAFVGLGVASYVPFWIGKLVHTKSIKTFGKVEARFSESLEAPLSQHAQAAHNSDNRSTRSQGFSATLAVGMTGAALTSKSGEQFIKKAKHAVADAAAVGLTLAGQPAAAAVVKAADSAVKAKQSREATAKAVAAEVHKTQNLPQPAPVPPTPAPPRPSAPINRPPSS